VLAFEQGDLGVEPPQQAGALPHQLVDGRVGLLQMAEVGLERTELSLELLPFGLGPLVVALGQRLGTLSFAKCKSF
jgi:hypothetical protein